jgi:hypothetical protein
LAPLFLEFASKRFYAQVCHLRTEMMCKSREEQSNVVECVSVSNQ